jgi:ATP-dependent DNA helicase RecQ
MDEGAPGVTAFETILLNELKSIRRDLAVNANVPPYLIVSDVTLVEMATYLPQSMDELRFIPGFGDIKLARYGREFLAPVKNYCQRHGLESRINQKTAKSGQKTNARPAASRSRSSDTRRETFNLYCAGKSIADIAAQRELATTTIEGHLSYFVQTGEMDVLEMVKEEKIPVIKDAVESYGYEKLSPLKEVLGDDYSYGEIKAVISWMNRDA